MPSLSLISMLSLFTLLLSLFSLMNASPIVSGPGSAAVGPAKLSMARRSSLDITEHSTGGTYDCAPRDIHCCEQTLGHTNENKAQKGGANGGGAGANGDGSGSGSNGSGSGSNVAKRSSSNPFENVLQMRDVVGNFGVNCSVSVAH